MKPLRLEIENLRSFRTKRIIDFSKLEIVAIIGDTGAGKTSILEAITYALFNRSTWSGRNVKELISRGASTMTVVFTFSVDAVTYEIVRVTRARGQAQHRLMCPELGIDVSGESDVEQAVRDALHLDDTAFLHTVLLPQDKHAELLTKDQRERNRILGELFRLDDIVKVGDLARVQENRAEMALNGLRRQRAQYGDNPSGWLAEVEKALEVAHNVLSRATAAVEAVQTIDSEARECNKTIEAHERSLQGLQPIAGHLRGLAALDEVEAKSAPAIEQAQRARSEAEEAKKTAEEDLKQLREAGRDVATLRTVKRELETLSIELREIQTERSHEADTKAKLAEAEARMRTAKAALEVAEAKNKEIGAACNRAADSAREDSTHAGALESALSDERNAFNRRDVLVTRRDVRKQQVEALKGDLRKAQESTSRAKAEYEHAARAREAAQVAQQAASCAQHLHAGDDCPICHRMLPTGFKAPEAPEVNESLDREREAQRAYEAASRAENTLLGQIKVEAESVEQDERDLREADTECRTVTAAVRALLPSENEDPQRLLETYKSRAVQAEKELPALRAALSESNAQLSKARTTYVSAEADHRNYIQGLEGLAYSISVRIGRCKSTCEAIPKGLRPEIEVEAVAQMLRLVNDNIRSAEAVEARVASANESIANALSNLSELQQRLSRDVFAPREALYAQIATIASNLDVPTQPKDEKSRRRWAKAVDKAAKSEESRLAKQIDGLNARCQDLSNKRADFVREVGGEPREVASEALLRKRDAERDLADARKRVSEATALDEKIARLEPVKMGLEALRDALGARGFPAYATQQRQTRLLEEATLIFQEMTDQRYGFTANFEIFDRETNDARSPHTLSGGEKFLASLALSLAVVEIASNAGAKIEALFLDEGFASLDAATLQTAMLELRKRSRAGRMICVISHLSQVAQFVDDTILVEETADGSDVRQQAGPIDDDASVVKSLVSHLASQTV